MGVTSDAVINKFRDSVSQLLAAAPLCLVIERAERGPGRAALLRRRAHPSDEAPGVKSELLDEARKLFTAELAGHPELTPQPAPGAAQAQRRTCRANPKPIGRPCAPTI